jgi:hypothetical protein
MHAEDLTAALADSRGHELTRRQPCDFNHGNPIIYVDGFDFHRPGIAEVMLVFCAGCGGMVAHRRLNMLMVYEERGLDMMIHAYPICGVPFDQRLRPRGES